jgi:hypothetical protein
LAKVIIYPVVEEVVLIGWKEKRLSAMEKGMSKNIRDGNCGMQAFSLVKLVS